MTKPKQPSPPPRVATGKVMPVGARVARAASFLRVDAEDAKIEMHPLWRLLLSAGGLGNVNIANHKGLRACFGVLILLLWGCSWHVTKALFHGSSEIEVVFVAWLLLCMNLTSKFFCLVVSVGSSTGPE